MGKATEDLNPHMQETVESVYRMIEEITGVSKARLIMKCSSRQRSWDYDALREITLNSYV